MVCSTFNYCSNLCASFTVFLDLSHEASMGKEQLVQQGWEFIRDVPFDSDRKKMSALYPTPYFFAFPFS